MAKNAHSTSVPTASDQREHFDIALSQAHIITSILEELATAAVDRLDAPSASLNGWLIAELKMRLEIVETADSLMKRDRA